MNMKIKLFILSLTLSYYSMASALPNLALVKQELEAYHDSGAYMTDIHTVIEQAKANLIIQANNNTEHKKLALVLDIDETSISNYNDLKSVGFGGNNDIWTKQMLQAQEPAIEPTLELYKLALKENVKVFFITGRSVKLESATEKMLKNDGYTTWAGLYLRTAIYKTSLAEDYKTAIRKNITEQGYDIIENVGDQYSDLIGGYADAQYKLPNPYYYIA